MPAVYIAIIFCVFGIAIGQILFKLSAISLKHSGSFFALDTAILLLSAMCLYGVTSLVWVWGLQKVELSQVYPFMALSFILVPLGSYFFLGEQLQPQYFLGVAIIIVGILVVLRV